MRIIGGNFKGKKLYSVRGSDIRPTKGKVREAVFNIYGQNILDARVLDLFAGSGAFGLEALSREAKSVVFIESDDRAISTLQKNIRMCGLESRTQCIKWDISRDLNCIRSLQHGFDLVFMDPPYYADFIAVTLKNLDNSLNRQNKAVVIIEHTAQTPFPDIYPPFFISDRRKYGKSVVTFLDFMLEKPL